MRALFCTLLVGALLTACRTSLREPGSIPPPPRASSGPREERDPLGEAEAWFSRGTLQAVRRAEQVWLAAAATEARRLPALVGLTRARIWLANHETRHEARRSAAASAVEAGQWCGMAAPGEAACDYQLALALGVQARERRSTALDALPRIVELLEQVASRSPGLDHAGPHRVLALLFLRAPGWPAGPGDPRQGLVQARRAVDLEPDYPPNQLCLAEALAAADDRAGRVRALRQALRMARRWRDAEHVEAGEWIEEAERELAAAGAD